MKQGLCSLFILILFNVCIIPLVKAGTFQSVSGPGYIDPSTGMSFVKVPAGCFKMGCGDWHWSSAKGSNCECDEKPVRDICLDQFYIGQFEVTQGQWQQVMGNNPSFGSDCGQDCPVENVSFESVRQFISKLNAMQKNGGRYRLPTEAEWEYACRSGGKKELFCGGNIVGPLAWYRVNSKGRSHRVGARQPNGLGIYDMSGNVLEWCSNFYGLYSQSESTNPKGPVKGISRVIRGGSWGSYTGRFCRSAYREEYIPRDASKFIGFRLVWDANTEE